MTQPALKDFTPVDGITKAEGGQVRVPLADGLTVGSVTYTAAVLRQLNAGAVLAAAEAAERLVYGPGACFLPGSHGGGIAAPSDCTSGGR